MAQKQLWKIMKYTGCFQNSFCFISGYSATNYSLKIFLLSFLLLDIRVVIFGFMRVILFVLFFCYMLLKNECSIKCFRIYLFNFANQEIEWFWSSFKLKIFVISIICSTIQDNTIRMCLSNRSKYYIKVYFPSDEIFYVNNLMKLKYQYFVQFLYIHFTLTIKLKQE